MVKLIMEFYSTSCNFLFLRSKCYPKRPAVEYFYVSPLSLGEQISSPRTTTVKDNSSIYILNFTFSDTRREGRKFSTEW